MQSNGNINLKTTNFFVWAAMQISQLFSIMETIFVLFFALLFSVQCTKSMPAEGYPSKISSVQLTPVGIPFLIGKPEMSLYEMKIDCEEGTGITELKNITINFSADSHPDCISTLTVSNADVDHSNFGVTQNVEIQTAFSGNRAIATGANFFLLNFALKPNVKLSEYFEIQDIVVSFGNNQSIKIKPESKFVYRPTLLLREAGQDQTNTYRIPGLATTNKGTLIAVYDNRYQGGGDLQGDIDVGMSRSTDGGQTWEPMKVVIDMGTFNGLPQNQNGVGDPTVLVDQNTNTIWVAGLWVSGIPGQSAWNGSKPGMKPDETGQFILVKSEDDGITWSQPINITSQCKRPEWNLFFQGPGKGITMKDGTLVFPAQYKDEQKIPFSTIICSKDHGKTWTVGTGAKSNTTESQVVQLPDGSLMLNMRDDRNKTEKGNDNGRAVSVTNDLGKTWTVHSSSNSALQESNCQASLISAKVLVGVISKEVLFFSNPNDKNLRAHMTIKASLDGGVTWPVACQTELNSADSFGYSCLTMVDENTLGILFEGTKNLYFQKISVSQLLGNTSK